MFLNDIYEQLATGELSQHKYGKSGAILPADYPALVSHINLALMELHKKFPINLKELQISQQSIINLYPLHSMYAVSTGANGATKYIIDTVEAPFLDDLIRIDAVYDDNGTIVPLNDESQVNSVFMAGYDTIQIPYAVDTANLFVLYRAEHERIFSTSDPLTTEVFLPSSLLEALMCYVAARCFSALNSPTSNATSSFYFGKFKMMCDEITDENILNEAYITNNSKLYSKGFV